MKIQNILFFADRLPPLVGGMEMHAGYFMAHFENHPEFPLAGVITKNTDGQDCLASQEGLQPIDIKDLGDLFDPTFVFFNSGRWIEELEQVRTLFPNSTFIYRTGGNEILKAPLTHKQLPNHSLRQSYWAKILNNIIDLLITNSAYTERRLREVGIICPFACCVGGVDTVALRKSVEVDPQAPLLTIFCAARFVPYKNHALLISIIHKLISRGYNLHVRLAGDGPLLPQIKEHVCRHGLTSVVEFLGVLDNKKVCQEIARANIYMQLSKDQMAEVPGGSYVHSEGMGRSILEALTAGTFIVAGRSGALSEIVTEDRGLLVELDDEEHITARIMQVLENPPARQPFCEDYSWSKIFQHYEALFGNIHENIAGYRKV